MIRKMTDDESLILVKYLMGRFRPERKYRVEADIEEEPIEEEPIEFPVKKRRPLPFRIHGHKRRQEVYMLMDLWDEMEYYYEAYFCVCDIVSEVLRDEL